MVGLSSCYFCGTAIEAPLSEYPVIPESLDPPADRQGTVVLCPTCRRKLRTVVEPIVETATEARVSPPTDPAQAGDPVEQATESGVTDPESGSPAADGSSQSSPDDRATSDGGVGAGDGIAIGPSPERDDGSGGIRIDPPGHDPDEGDDSADAADSAEDTPDTTDDAAGEAETDDATEAESAAGDASPADAETSENETDDGGVTGWLEADGDSESDPEDSENDLEDAESDTNDPGETDDEAADETEGGEADDEATDETGGERSFSAAKYNRVVRLLQNREFPVEKEEIAVVAKNAYDISGEEFEAIVGAIVVREEIDERKGKLVRL